MNDLDIIKQKIIEVNSNITEELLELIYQYVSDKFIAERSYEIMTQELLSDHELSNKLIEISLAKVAHKEHP